MFWRRNKEQKQEDDAKIEESLVKTKRGFFNRIAGLFTAGDITPAFWDQLEELLILADVGGNTSIALVEKVREAAEKQGLKKTNEVEDLFKQYLAALLQSNTRGFAEGPRMLTVILVVGVNGSGKTTSIAKLGKWYKDQGRKVAFAAADTFRAAAIDQLKIWGERVDVPVFASQPGADPGAVVYDAIRACLAREMDTLVIDTAGRLHTKFNLMQEVTKLRSVAAKQVHRAPHETLLVLDATTGQNGLTQAKVFKDTVEVTGLILTKLDGTSKGGIVFSISQELNLPIYFVGTGEGINDFAAFDPDVFVAGLFKREAQGA
ncbi:MAG: signal recognition particle-docking protein FtsY [Chloroflexi bacterium]|nr:signal recognition particle-docking protein FtsY [Chloroflexota bacterium]